MLLGTEIMRIMAPALREIAVQYGGRGQLQSNIIIISGIINQGLQWAWVHGSTKEINWRQMEEKS